MPQQQHGEQNAYSGIVSDELRALNNNIEAARATQYQKNARQVFDANKINIEDLQPLEKKEADTKSKSKQETMQTAENVEDFFKDVKSQDEMNEKIAQLRANPQLMADYIKKAEKN